MFCIKIVLSNWKQLLSSPSYAFLALQVKAEILLQGSQSRVQIIGNGDGFLRMCSALVREVIEACCLPIKASVQRLFLLRPTKRLLTE